MSTLIPMRLEKIVNKPKIKTQADQVNKIKIFQIDFAAELFLK